MASSLHSGRVLLIGRSPLLDGNFCAAPDAAPSRARCQSSLSLPTMHPAVAILGREPVRIADRNWPFPLVFPAGPTLAPVFRHGHSTAAAQPARSLSCRRVVDRVGHVRKSPSPLPHGRSQRQRGQAQAARRDAARHAGGRADPSPGRQSDPRLRSRLARGVGLDGAVLPQEPPGADHRQQVVAGERPPGLEVTREAALLGPAPQLTRRSRPAQKGSRSLYFCSLPVAVRSSASRNSIAVGHLKWAMRPRVNSIRSRSVACCPGRRTTRALMVSPHFSSGTPMTATSATAGCWKRQSSTSIDETFSPPVMMTSFFRSAMTVYAPSACPPSPVWNHPSARALADSSGWFQ